MHCCIIIMMHSLVPMNFQGTFHVWISHRRLAFQVQGDSLPLYFHRFSAYEILTGSGDGDGKRLDWRWLFKTSGEFSTISSRVLGNILDIDLTSTPSHRCQSPPQDDITFFSFGNKPLFATIALLSFLGQIHFGKISSQQNSPDLTEAAKPGDESLICQ